MENFCEMCGDPDESVYHVVLLCPVARRFWDEVGKLTGVRIPDLHPCTWATDVLHADICPASSAATLICGAWTLWTGRNARRHGCKVWEPGATARYISSMLEELSSLKMPPQGVKPRRQVKWQRSDERWIKVNTDAAFDSNTCTGRAGVVIRDHLGLVQVATARWLDDVLDALTAEAMVAKEGLELAVENGYDRVLLEVDCRG